MQQNAVPAAAWTLECRYGSQDNGNLCITGGSVAYRSTDTLPYCHELGHTHMG